MQRFLAGLIFILAVIIDITAIGFGLDHTVVSVWTVLGAVVGLYEGGVLSEPLRKPATRLPWLDLIGFGFFAYIFEISFPIWVVGLTLLYCLFVAGCWLFSIQQFKSRTIYLADLNTNVSLADYYQVYKKENSRAVLLERYTRKLKESPVPVESVYVPTRFGPTHVLTAGPLDAPPLILLHAAVGEALQWLPMLPPLVEHYRVYAPDVIGKGGRSMPVVLDAVSPDYAYWLLDVMAGLGLQHARFAGEGGGTWLIFKLAQVAPTAIERAVLVGPTRIVPPSPSPESQKAHQQMKTNLNMTTVRNYMQTLWLPGVDLPEKVVQNGFESMSAHKRNVNFKPFPILNPLELVKLRIPTLVLLGRDVRIEETLATKQELYKYLPQLQVTLMPGSSALLSEAQPEAVAIEVARFMLVESPALG